MPKTISKLILASMLVSSMSCYALTGRDALAYLTTFRDNHTTRTSTFNIEAPVLYAFGSFAGLLMHSAWSNHHQPAGSKHELDFKQAATGAAIATGLVLVGQILSAEPEEYASNKVSSALLLLKLKEYALEKNKFYCFKHNYEQLREEISQKVTFDPSPENLSMVTFITEVDSLIEKLERNLAAIFMARKKYRNEVAMQEYEADFKERDRKQTPKPTGGAAMVQTITDVMDALDANARRKSLKLNVKKTEAKILRLTTQLGLKLEDCIRFARENRLARLKDFPGIADWLKLGSKEQEISHADYRYLVRQIDTASTNVKTAKEATHYADDKQLRKIVETKVAQQFAKASK